MIRYAVAHRDLQPRTSPVAIAGNARPAQAYKQ
jgi:hypothetical protein